MTDQLLRVPEVAKRLDYSVWTIRRLLREGELTGIKRDHGPWRIPESSLREYIEAHSNTAARAS